MKLPHFSRIVATLSLLLTGPLYSAAILDILPGVNNVQITEVTYFFEGTEVTQTEEAADVLVVGDDEVRILSLKVNDGGIVNLEYFNTDGATVFNTNPELASINGTGTYDHGTITNSSAGISAFNDAIAVTTTDTDLRNYVFSDLLTPAPPTSGVPDYDIRYTRAMKVDDYIVVSERWGNSFIEVTPLKADGTPYAGANILRFGGTGGGAYEVFDWNTGVAAAGNYTDQAQTLTVASVSKFFENTGTTAGPVYGFRIDNDGEADTKFMIVSHIQIVPEPSVFLLSVASALAFLTSRNRKSAS